MHERNWTKDFNWELQAKLHLYPTFTLLSGEIHVIPHTLISITPIIIRSTLKKRDREWLWYCSFQNGSSNFILFLKKPLLTEEEKKKLNCTSFLYIYTPEYNILRKGIWSYHIHTPKLHVWESIINKKNIID